MSDTSTSHDRLIQELATGLKPVRRLPAPGLRALIWIGVVAILAGILASFSDLAALRHRLTMVPDMYLAVAGSVITALLAAFAAFQTSVPDRKPAWALLPLPGLALWLGASGLGCLRTWIIPGTTDATMADSKHCLVFIIGVSLPLSVLLVTMLRRAYPLRPALTATLGGLAAAAAAATLLNFFHPYDASATDLAVHALAVILAVAASRGFGSRALARSGA